MAGKQRVAWVWAFAAVLVASGGTWLAALIWKTSALGGQAHGPQLVGALLAGLTIARATTFPRRHLPIAIAAGGAGAWVALQLAVYLVRDEHPLWTAPFTGSPVVHFALVAVLASAIAGAAASLRFRGREDHRLLWLWISALITLGSLVTSLVVATNERLLPASAVAFVFAAPIAAGALTQTLAPFRMIWTCGGGAVIFVLIVFEQGLRAGETGVIVGTLGGVGIFVLLGALGARLGWRLFRNADPRTRPDRADLPTATTG